MIFDGARSASVVSVSEVGQSSPVYILMVKQRMTDPIVAGARERHDPLQFYRSPLFRTMSGYKLLSGAFLLCGTVAVPALLYTGQQAGITGSLVVAAASMTPITLQTIFVPRYIARMSLVRPAPLTTITNTTGQTRQESRKANASSMAHSTAPIDILDSLVPQSQIRIEYFTFSGFLRTKLARIADLRPHRDFRWVNWKTSDGLALYVDKEAAGPILKKIVRMIDRPREPETWRTY